MFRKGVRSSSLITVFAALSINLVACDVPWHKEGPAASNVSRLIAAGELHFQMRCCGPHLQQALAAYRQAIIQDPENLEARIALVRTLLIAGTLNSGKYRQQALELVSAAHGIMELEGGRMPLAFALINMSQDSTGLDEAKRWLDMASDQADEMMRLSSEYPQTQGNLQFLLGLVALRHYQLEHDPAQIEEALRRLSMAVGLQPRSLRYRHSLLSAYRAKLENVPDNRIQRTARALLNVNSPLEAPYEAEQFRANARKILH